MYVKTPLACSIAAPLQINSCTVVFLRLCHHAAATSRMRHNLKASTQMTSLHSWQNVTGSAFWVNVFKMSCRVPGSRIRKAPQAHRTGWAEMTTQALHRAIQALFAPRAFPTLRQVAVSLLGLRSVTPVSPYEAVVRPADSSADRLV